MTTTLLAAATPWTFWMAPTLLVIVLVATAVAAVRYYRSVMVPAQRLRLREERLQLNQLRNRSTATVHPLGRASHVAHARAA